MINIYKPSIKDFDNSEKLYDYLQAYLVDRILDVNGEEGVVRLAFSGGSSTEPIFRKMANISGVPWESVHIYQIDERFVDVNDPESNQGVMLRSLGFDLSKEIGGLHFFDTKLLPDLAVKDFMEKLDSLDGPYFDTLILGAGIDGHIASLFAGGKYFQTEDSVLQITAPPEFKVAKRLSLSINSILNSKEIILILPTSQKLILLEEMLNGRQAATNFPMKFLLAHPNLKIFRSED